jgi:hypothetical protein
VGVYVKVGQLVHCQGRVRTDSASGGGDTLQLGGLPFANTATSQAFGAINIAYNNLWVADHHPKGGYISPNTTAVTLTIFNSSDPRDDINDTILTTELSNSANSNDLIFSVHYRTDS